MGGVERDWHVLEYDGDCKHNVKAKVKEQGYGTRYCEMCGASLSNGVWRVLVDGPPPNNIHPFHG